MAKRRNVDQQNLEAQTPEATDKLAWAELHENAGQYEQAILEYRDVIGSSPSPERAVTALMGLGTCLELTGKKQQAFQVL